MADQICSAIEAAIETAIDKVVQDFQRGLDRFWNERDIHCLLFHYLQLEHTCKEEYPAQLIRAEFPTRKVFKERGCRGHYDLAVLDSESYFSPEVQDAKAQDPRQLFLDLIKIQAAVEIKLWLTRCSPEDMAERIDWDIKKLTETPNNIQFAYFINLVQLPFKEPYIKFYGNLNEYLQKIKHDNLRILFAPADRRFDLN